jgi:hypothetical protein
VIGMTYDQAALARGDSRRYFMLHAIRAALQISLLLIGVLTYGLIGALCGMALAGLLTHIPVIWLARAHGVWDMRHDSVFFIFWISIALLTYVLHSTLVVDLLGQAGRM